MYFVETSGSSSSRSIGGRKPPSRLPDGGGIGARRRHIPIAPAIFGIIMPVCLSVSRRTDCAADDGCAGSAGWAHRLRSRARTVIASWSNGRRRGRSSLEGPARRPYRSGSDGTTGRHAREGSRGGRKVGVVPCEGRRSPAVSMRREGVVESGSGIAEYQAHNVVRRFTVPEGTAGTAGPSLHHAPRQGRGDSGREDGRRGVDASFP
jgi:hypothetical protein